jgi:hypothetical protein
VAGGNLRVVDAIGENGKVATAFRQFVIGHSHFSAEIFERRPDGIGHDFGSPAGGNLLNGGLDFRFTNRSSDLGRNFTCNHRLQFGLGGRGGTSEGDVPPSEMDQEHAGSDKQDQERADAEPEASRSENLTADIGELGGGQRWRSGIIFKRNVALRTLHQADVKRAFATLRAPFVAEVSHYPKDGTIECGGKGKTESGDRNNLRTSQQFEASPGNATLNPFSALR